MSSRNLTVSPPRKHSGGALLLTVYGEKTSLPIEVRKAVVRTTEKPVVYINKALVSVELDLVNTAVQKDNVSAKLHLTLPATASVRRFELCHAGDKDDIWFPATAVPKKKAAAVVYQEKEKGRAVASVSNAAAASNIFEMEISPMPFEKIVKSRLEIMVQGSELQTLVDSMFPRDSSTQLTVERVQQEQQPNDDFAGAVGNDYAGAVVGTCFGKTHFCKIPGDLTNITGRASGNGMNKNTIRRMAIFQDTSSSMIPTKEQTANRETRLRELLLEAGASSGEIVVELFTFDILGYVQLGIYSNADEVASALSTVEYDGGTSLAVLQPAISGLANRSTNKIDCVCVVTDGVDVTASDPAVTDWCGNPVSFPVHCIADGETINLPAL